VRNSAGMSKATHNGLRSTGLSRLLANQKLWIPSSFPESLKRNVPLSAGLSARSSGISEGMTYAGLLPPSCLPPDHPPASLGCASRPVEDLLGPDFLSEVSTSPSWRPSTMYSSLETDFALLYTYTCTGTPT